MAATRSSTGLLLAISLVWGSTWIANGMLADAGSALHISVLRYMLACVWIALFFGVRQLVRRLQRRALLKQAPPDADASIVDATTAPTSPIQPMPRPALARTHTWLKIGIVLGFSMFAVPDLLLVWADRHGAAPWTPMIYAALPLGLLLVRGELRPAAIVGLSGMLVLLNGSLPVTASKLLWVLPIVAAVALQGWTLLYIRPHLTEASSVRCMLMQMMTAVLALEVALRLWPKQAQALPVRSWPASSLGALCLLAGMATAAAYPLYFRLLRGLEPAQIASSAWLQTVVAVSESAVLVRQMPGWHRAGAMCLLILGMACMLREDRGEQVELRIFVS